MSKLPADKAFSYDDVVDVSGDTLKDEMESKATAFRVRADALLTAEGVAILNFDLQEQR